MKTFAMIALALIGMTVLAGCTSTCNKCKAPEPTCGCTTCSTCDK